MNNGVARISSRALLQSSGEFVNNGLLDLLTATGEIPTNLINNGFVIVIVINSGDLKLSAFSFANGTITLQLITYAGHSYQLQPSSSLTADSWIDLGSKRVGSGSEQVFTYTPSQPPIRRFYRILVTP